MKSGSFDSGNLRLCYEIHGEQGVPMVVQTAVHLGLNLRAFVVMIAVAASTAYLTPLAPACLIVYRSGRCRFIDFLKVCGLLTVLAYLLALTLMPMLWPLY